MEKSNMKNCDTKNSDFEEEIWKPIKGYENRYLVSNKGRIKHLEKFVKCKNGQTNHYLEKTSEYHTYDYPFVILSDGKKKKKYLVHRLVAEAFVPNDDNKPCVNHIDYNPRNNNASNLEWVTVQENYKWSKDRIVKSLLNTRRNHRTNTGEHHVHFVTLIKNGKAYHYYQVHFKSNHKDVTKRLKTLEEAVSFREQWIEGE